MVSIVKYLYESNLSDAAKSAALIGGLVTGGGALYNTIKHGEVFGDEGIDVPKSAIGSAGLTFALNAFSPSEKKALKKELVKTKKVEK